MDHAREELDRRQCIALLRRTTVGRLGVSSGALPHVEPVAYRLVDDEVFVRVGRRTRLDIAATDNVVAFEVDSFDPVDGSGWSVVVTGVARRVESLALTAASGDSELRSWGGDGEFVLAISTSVVTGTRVGPSIDERLGEDRFGTADVLSLNECWSLLTAEEIGRLAVIRGSAPTITPINYVVDDRTIVFRTDPGTKFHQGPRSQVCFEIDGLDHATRSGWSVVVSGLLEEIVDEAAARFGDDGPEELRPWAGGRKEHVMRLVPHQVTGRRVHRGAVATNGVERVGSGRSARF